MDKPLIMHLVTALLALLIERALGYPRALQRAVGHPVEWMGAMIAWADARFNRSTLPPAARVVLGALVMLALVVFWGGLAWLIGSWLPWWAQGVLASTLLAQRSLTEHVRAIIDALDARASGDLSPARRALSMIVGRDTARFDESEIAHATVESLAENASDGIIAPLFWLAVLGLPGIVVYKLVNTADSMIGHLDDRHAHFGKAAARLDDTLNIIPARLTSLLYALAATFFKGVKAGRRTLATSWRDARKHVSPNAGWPESAMAGALDIRLGGPRSYAGRVVDFPWLGDGRKDLSRADIEAALVLHERMLWLVAAIMALMVLLALAADTPAIFH